ncbi:MULTISPECIES: hypothetical protein [unclassified Streptomyces]|uniref:hypothetical protein n=1 Tax=unclassified Streptomyces TaxID=2593676 RepID=UPI00048B7482|nr:MULTISPECIES: hypothetical protein [unclassified Streptomyces]MYY16517.1 hypothetical protein [Streptomyces sp. SID4912]SCD85271.1 hypothetical protein GA0115241_1070277 [Streptomyces sp. DpondAA-D4]
MPPQGGIVGARRLVRTDDALAPELLAVSARVSARALLRVRAQECFVPLGLVVLYERLAEIGETAVAGRTRYCL